MYVVTGASGNSGHVVAEKLLASGEKVRAIGRSPERLQRRTAHGAETCVCDLVNRPALVKAFRGAEGVYLMIPPDLTSKDFRDHQECITESMAQALEDANVERAVALSSIGADKPRGTGPVVGLRHLEQRLNGIGRLNVLTLRAGYFMENTFAQIGIIRAMGVAAGPLRPDLKIPMIATRDIGKFAADALLARDFKGQQNAELLGQRDISMDEAARIIGKAIGKPNLAYKQLPDSQIRPALIGIGMPRNIADLLLEMSQAMNSGHIAALENRSAPNTTPTSYETFVEEEFLPRFRAMSTAA